MRCFSRLQTAIRLSGCALASLTFCLSGSAQEPENWVLQKWPTIVKSAALSPDGKIAVTMSEEGVFTLWDAKTGQTLRELKAHSRSSISNSPAVFSPDSSKVLTV